MIDLVLTVMISAFSLAQSGQPAITTNELPPPPGLSNAKPTTSAATKALPAKQAETVSQAPAESERKAEPDNARPPVSNVSSAAEAAQPTTEEKQAPTQKQAAGSGSPGRVAAFWFILPNRPPGNK